VSLSSETSPLPGASGDWTRLRWWLLPAMLIPTLFGWAELVSTFIRPGSIRLNHIAPGTDWMVFYGAVRSALTGHLSLIMNGDDFTAWSAPMWRFSSQPAACSPRRSTSMARMPQPAAI
jgi:hypothetical protein